jgi:hypothetical protein
MRSWGHNRVLGVLREILSESPISNLRFQIVRAAGGWGEAVRRGLKVKCEGIFRFFFGDWFFRVE